MRIVIAAVGRLKDGPERTLFARYADRIDNAGKGVALGPLEHVEINEARHASADSRRTDEGQRLAAKTAAAGCIAVLDEGGKAMTSAAFAAWLQTLRDDGLASVAFLIGGPDGHGAAAREQARLTLSLGPMTLPHGLARVVLAEQIYRAQTILAGHPYHRA